MQRVALKTMHLGMAAGWISSLLLSFSTVHIFTTIKYANVKSSDIAIPDPWHLSTYTIAANIVCGRFRNTTTAWSSFEYKHLRYFLDQYWLESLLTNAIDSVELWTVRHLLGLTGLIGSASPNSGSASNAAEAMKSWLASHLHIGHKGFREDSHWSMHSMWNRCWHGSTRSLSPSLHKNRAVRVYSVFIAGRIFYALFLSLSKCPDGVLERQGCSLNLPYCNPAPVDLMDRRKYR